MRRQLPSTATAMPLLALATGAWVGIYVRVVGLGDQIPVDDEIHGINAAMLADARYLFTHNHLLGGGDFSTPLALWNQLLLNTIGLSEVGLRGPVVAAGILAMLVAGGFCWRWFGPRAAAIATWVFALTPVLVLYSRFARPYMPVALLSLLALLGWREWEQSKRWRWALVSALGGSLAVSFNVLAFPVVLWIWSYGLVAGLAPVRSGEDRRAPGSPGWLRGLGLWVLGVSLTGVLVAPVLESLLEFSVDKVRAQPPGSEDWWRALQTLLGTRGILAPILVLTTSTWGFFVALRRDPLLAVLLLSAILAQAAAIHLIAPFGTRNPSVLLRYSMAAVPALLLLLALGLLGVAEVTSRVASSQERLRSLALLAPILAVLLALVVSGPIPRLYSEPNSYTNHVFNYRFVRWWSLDAQEVPEFYRHLGAPPSRWTIVEAPWVITWDLTIYGLYQSIHRQEVRTMTSSAILNDPRIRFRSFVPYRDGSFSAKGVDLFVIHRDVPREVYHVTGRPWPRHVDRALRGYRTTVRRQARQFLRDLLARDDVQRVYRDEWITVYASRDFLKGQQVSAHQRGVADRALNGRMGQEQQENPGDPRGRGRSPAPVGLPPPVVAASRPACGAHR